MAFMAPGQTYVGWAVFLTPDRTRPPAAIFVDVDEAHQHLERVQAGGANPQAGDVFMFNGATFVYQRPTPFGGYWRKLS